jgi:hypothetical protein
MSTSSCPNMVTVSSGDKRNIAGFLIWHSILLDSPFEEPLGKDQLLDDLLLRKHSYTVSQANS